MPTYSIIDTEVNNTHGDYHAGIPHSWTLRIWEEDPDHYVGISHCATSHREALRLPLGLTNFGATLREYAMEMEPWNLLEIELEQGYPRDLAIQILGHIARAARGSGLVETARMAQYLDGRDADLYAWLTTQRSGRETLARSPRRDPVTGRFVAPATITETAEIPEPYSSSEYRALWNTEWNGDTGRWESRADPSGPTFAEAAPTPVNPIWTPVDPTTINPDDDMSVCAHCSRAPEEAGGEEWWRVEQLWDSDTCYNVHNALVCEDCKPDFHECEHPRCIVVSNGRQTARGYGGNILICEIENHDEYYWCEYCEMAVDPEAWNEHFDRCAWCAEDRDVHEDCEECDTQGHDYDCECEYCMEEGNDFPGACTCHACNRDRENEYGVRGARDRVQSQRVIRNYSYRPEFLAFPTGEPAETYPKLLLGIELEVSFKPSYDPVLTTWYPKYKDVDIDGEIKEFFYIKSDSSVTNGFEIVTMPFEPQWALDHLAWDEMFQELIDDYGAYESHKSCGQHIHINKSAFDMAHFWKFVQFHQKLGQFCGLIGGRGVAAPYGSFEVPAWKNMPKVLKELSKTKGKYNEKMYNWYPERYSALNVEPPTTIEMRYPAGDITPANIKKNIQWVMSVFEYTDYIDIKDVQDGAIDTPNNYLWWIKSQPERFKDLIAYLETIIPQPKPLRERS